jgi:hypothetical protein
MSAALDHDPLAIDPRPCGLCGLTIDQHRVVDTGEGLEFFCLDENVVGDDAASVVARWEMADPRDRWRRTGEAPPPEAVRNADIVPLKTAPRHYHTPQSTVDAFWYVVRLKEPDRLAAWLRDHPRDAPFLLKSLEAD